jgi:hypothetical protein
MIELPPKPMAMPSAAIKKETGQYHINGGDGIGTNPLTNKNGVDQNIERHDQYTNGCRDGLFDQ